MSFSNRLVSLFPSIAVVFLISPKALADEIVTCKSHDHKYTHCNTRSDGYISLHKQLSNTDCKQGRNWDYDRHGIWVDEGCKAEFMVESDRDDDYRRSDYRNDDYRRDEYHRDDYRHDNHEHSDNRGNYSKEVIAGMTIYRNVKRSGADYRNFNSGNVKRCAEACADDRRCKAFNFGKEHKDCHLKDNVPNGNHNTTVVSGVKNR